MEKPRIKPVPREGRDPKESFLGNIQKRLGTTTTTTLINKRSPGQLPAGRPFPTRTWPPGSTLGPERDGHRGSSPGSAAPRAPTAMGGRGGEPAAEPREPPAPSAARPRGDAAPSSKAGPGPAAPTLPRSGGEHRQASVSPRLPPRPLHAHPHRELRANLSANLYFPLPLARPRAGSSPKRRDGDVRYPKIPLHRPNTKRSRTPHISSPELF